MKTIGFNETGRRERKQVDGERISRREAAAAVTAMQQAKDAHPLRRIYKPLKPPPCDFGPQRSRAGAIEAARLNANRVDPELHPGTAEVATSYYPPRSHDDE